MKKPNVFLSTYKSLLACGVLIVIILALIILLAHNKISKVMGKAIIKPLDKKTIVLDPGHGGIDGGTNFGQILEKNINLEIGLILREELSRRGARIIMTRETDDSLEGQMGEGSRHKRDLNTRVDTINDSKADLFISIHTNYTKNSRKNGPIVFYSIDGEENQKLAKYIQTHLNRLSSYEKLDISPDHDITVGDFYLLKKTNPPGVIVETGFISNETDRKLLLDEEHQKEIAELIVKGIIDYFMEGY